MVKIVDLKYEHKSKDINKVEQTEHAENYLGFIFLDVVSLRFGSDSQSGGLWGGGVVVWCGVVRCGGVVWRGVV